MKISACFVIHLILSMLPSKVSFWFAKQQRNPRALTMQGERLPHLVRKNNLLGQQKRIQPLIFAIELKIL